SRHYRSDRSSSTCVWGRALFPASGGPQLRTMTTLYPCSFDPGARQMATNTTPPRPNTTLTTERYPLTSLEPAAGDGIATAASHSHEARAASRSLFDPAIIKG